ASTSGLANVTSTPFDIGFAASVNQWINTSGGNWSNAANWSKGTVPVPSESVAVTLAGSYTVNLDTTFTGSFLLVGGNSGSQTLALSGRTLTINGGLTVTGTGTFSATSSSLAGAGPVLNKATLLLKSSTINAGLSNQGLLLVNGGS